MDDLDRASALETREREAAIARARQMGIGIGPAPVGARDCEDCGEPIPQARIDAVPHAERCAFCQREIEQ